MTFECAHCGQHIDYAGNPIVPGDETPLCYNCADSESKTGGWGRQLVVAWARGQVARFGTLADDDVIGTCPTCVRFVKRFETAQNHVNGYCVHVCRTCGDVIDESPPF